jgi:hypothetical protein
MGAVPSYKGFRFPVEIISHWCVQRKGWLIMYVVDLLFRKLVVACRCESGPGSCQVAR